MTARNVLKLDVVEPAPDASILKSGGAPIASGKGDTDLVCGRCGDVLVRGETATEVALQYKVMHLVIRCSCGSHNALASVSRRPYGDARDKLIAEAAYFRAEKRGFAPGYALEDWVTAEAQVGHELAHPNDRS